MDPTALELITRLRSNPDDAFAFAALRAHYQRIGDAASLANLLEGWATRARDDGSAASAFYEAAEIVADVLGDLVRGVSLLERALERRPLHHEAFMRLEALLTSTAQLHRLADVLERRALATEATGDTMAAAEQHHRLGELLTTRLDRPDRGVLHHRRAFELAPEFLPAVYAAREIYRRAGNPQAADTLYELEVQGEHDAARRVALLRELAKLRLETLGDADGAVQATRRARALAPRDVSIEHELATALLVRAARGEPSPALDRKEAADLFHSVARSVHPAHALPYVLAALDAAPDHEDALLLLEAVSIGEGRTDLLPPRWVAYLQCAPFGGLAGEVRKRLAEAYVEAGQVEDALVAIDPLVASGDLDACTFAEPLCIALGRDDDARRALAGIVAVLPPETAKDRLRRARDGAVQRGRRAHAVALANDLLAIDGADTETLAFLEGEARQAGDVGGLRSLLVAAARVPRATIEARKVRLREAAELSEHHLDDIDGAIDAYRLLLEVDPSDAVALQELERLLALVSRFDELVDVLERRCLTTLDAIERGRYLERIAHVHRDEREDPAGAIGALRRLRELRPSDDRVREMFVDALLAAGAFKDAIPLLREKAATLPHGRARSAALEKLADVLEEGVGDADAAFQTLARMLDDEEAAPRALARMERIDERAARYDRLLETLSYRAEITGAGARGEVYVQMARVAEEKLGDFLRASEYLRRAVEEQPARTELLDELARVYERTGRHRELCTILRDRAELEADPRRRAEAYRRIARILERRVRNPVGAAEAWEEVLAVGEDAEALAALLGRAEEHAELAEAAVLAVRLANVVDDRAQMRELSLRSASYHADLGRDEDALAQLRALFTEDRNDPAVAAKLEAIAMRVGDRGAVLEAIEAQAATASDPLLRIGALRRLLDWVEHDPAEAERAHAAYLMWLSTAEDDAEPARRLASWLERNDKLESLIEALDELADRTDGAEREEALARAVVVLRDHVGDADAAFDRAAKLLEAGSAGMGATARALAEEAGRGRELAELYESLGARAHGAERRALYLAATDVWENVARDPEAAFGTALEALRTRAAPEAVGDAAPSASDRADPAELPTTERHPPGAHALHDEAVLDLAERLARTAATVDTFIAALEAKIRSEAGPEGRARIHVRLAWLLEQSKRDVDGALDHALRALAGAPLDEQALARAEHLAPLAGRAEELLVVYDRRRQAAPTPADRLDMYLRATRLVSEQLRDEPRARTALAQAITFAVREGATSTLFERVRAGGLGKETGAQVRRVADAALALASTHEIDHSFEAELALTVADAYEKLGSALDAHRALAVALEADPTQRTLDRAIRAAFEAKRGEELEATLTNLALEVVDRDAMRRLLEAKVAVLNHLGRYDEATSLRVELDSQDPPTAVAPMPVIPIPVVTVGTVPPAPPRAVADLRARPAFDEDDEPPFDEHEIDEDEHHVDEDEHHVDEDEHRVDEDEHRVDEDEHHIDEPSLDDRAVEAGPPVDAPAASPNERSALHDDALAQRASARSAREAWAAVPPDAASAAPETASTTHYEDFDELRDDADEPRASTSFGPADDVRAAFAELHAAMREDEASRGAPTAAAGRDASAIGLDGRPEVGAPPAEDPSHTTDASEVDEALDPELELDEELELDDAPLSAPSTASGPPVARSGPPPVPTARDGSRAEGARPAAMGAAADATASHRPPSTPPASHRPPSTPPASHRPPSTPPASHRPPSTPPASHRPPPTPPAPPPPPLRAGRSDAPPPPGARSSSPPPKSGELERDRG